MKAKIFVSHTDSHDADASAFRAELSSGLEQQGFEVILDEQRLQLNADWRRQLYLWMLSSHAGVILVSEKALAGSEWMRFEASVLVMLRIGSGIAAEQSEEQPPFPVIPVLVPPVSRKGFKGSWLEPLALDAIQGGSSNVSTLVEQIATRLQPLQAKLEQTPLRPLQNVIRPWLQKVDPDTLRAAGRALGAKEETWRDDELADRLTAELVTADLGKGLAAVQQLAPQLPTQARPLPKILAAGWVDPEAAARIAPIATCEGRRAVGINGSRSQFTARAYVQRAAGRFPSWEVVCATEQGELDVEGIAAEILAAVRRSHVQIESDDDAARYIERAARRQPFFVAVQAAPEQHTVEALTARFPAATFVFLSGPAVPPEAERTRSGVEYLLPELEADREDDAYFDWVEAEGIFESVGGGG